MRIKLAKQSFGKILKPSKYVVSTKMVTQWKKFEWLMDGLEIEQLKVLKSDQNH